MIVRELFAQAELLDSQERKELIKLLVDTIDTPAKGASEPIEHWGKALNHLMDEIGALEFVFPDIQDPVEWVAALRAAERTQRGLADWDGNS
ncbi:MAG: hypothetical protein SGJ24_04065 [Chloroflexota bacterium]|nr:hypothetical protein [Chloroflexota bacterium]